MKRPRKLLSGLGPAPAQPDPEVTSGSSSFVRKRIIIQANLEGGITAEWVFEMGYSEAQQSYYIDRIDSPGAGLGVELQAPKITYGTRDNVERGWELIKEQFEWPRYYYAEFEGDNPNPVATNDPSEVASGAPDPSDDYLPVQLGDIGYGICQCGFTNAECDLISVCDNKQ